MYGGGRGKENPQTHLALNKTAQIKDRFTIGKNIRKQKQQNQIIVSLNN